MSNLGAYQTMTTWAKRFKGPKIFMSSLVAFGIITGSVGTFLGTKAIKKIKRHKRDNSHIYTVNREGSSNEGLLFNIDDKFRILETDEDAILIEKIGDNNSPYFVAKELLENISDYKDFQPQNNNSQK